MLTLLITRSATAGAVALAGLFTASLAQAVPVDTELSLLIDVSGSINSYEFGQQRQGYIDAFRDPTLQAAILDRRGGSRLGSIAVNVISWSSQAVESIGWTLIDSVASAEAFADTLTAMDRAKGIGILTGPANAINLAVTSLTSNTFEGRTTVLDVSGDGIENFGPNTITARDAALAKGVDRINGLAIGPDVIPIWYDSHLTGGIGNFVLAETTFYSFGPAIKAKLGYEIRGDSPPPVPLPAAGWLLIGGAAALIALRRRKRG